MLIDAHTHIDRYDLLEEGFLESALDEIHHHRIFTLSNSMDIPSYQRNLEISKNNDLILPLFGIHPWNAPEYVSRLDDLHDLISRSPILGEIGLDYFFVEDPSEYPLQRKVFDFFLSEAQDQDKIICLHTKGAEEAVLEMLQSYELPGVLIHWYSGSIDMFNEYVARDAYFTFGVELLYSEHIQNLAKQVAEDRLLTETDNPGGLRSLIGRPGMPSLINDVIDKIAQLRGKSTVEIIQLVQSNMLHLLEKDTRLLNTSLPLLAKE